MGVWTGVKYGSEYIIMKSLADLWASDQHFLKWQGIAQIKNIAEDNTFKDCNETTSPLRLFFIALHLEMLLKFEKYLSDEQFVITRFKI